MVALATRRVGSDGELVVLVHGSLTGSALTWPRQAPLSRQLRLLLVDRRGFDASPPAERDDWALDAEDLVELLDSLGEPVHLVAHSYGALGSMLAAVERPAAVRSLAVVEPPAIGLVPDHPDAMAVVATIDASKRDPERTLGSPEAMEEWLLIFFAEAGVDVERLHRPMPPAVIAAGRPLFLARPGSEYRIALDRLAAAPFPKLAVTGRSRPYYEAVGDLLRDRCGFERAILEGRGHAVQLLGRPFNDLLLDFIARASTPGATA